MYQLHYLAYSGKVRFKILTNPFYFGLALFPLEHRISWELHSHGVAFCACLTVIKTSSVTEKHRWFDYWPL